MVPLLLTLMLRIRVLSADGITYEEAEPEPAGVEVTGSEDLDSPPLLLKRLCERK